ncbi:MAG: copper resistance protein CopC [Acetobacteraceae bacterium]|nr:copper resistance protein CopC [Acetobacteraceae bacterium]
MHRSLLTALLMAAAVMLSPAAASAHAFLKSASPAVGSTVDVAPGTIALTFTESLEPDFSSIVVQDAHAAQIDKKDSHPVPGDPTRLAVSVGSLSPGTYTVIWHVTSTDTHKTTGKFSFTVAH